MSALGGLCRLRKGPCNRYKRAFWLALGGAQVISQIVAYQSSGMVPKFNADFGSESSGLARRRRGAYSTLPPNNRSALP